MSCRWALLLLFLIQLATLCLLIGGFGALTFKMIIDSYVLTAIWYLFSGCFCNSPLFFLLRLVPSVGVHTFLGKGHPVGAEVHARVVTRNWPEPHTVFNRFP